MNFTPAFTIAKKRDGGTLSSAEIDAFIDGYARDVIPDYQMSALAMAIYLQGMSTEETAALTHAMLHSGDVMTWDDDGRAVVDKHSTGGIGDKVSLLLAPLLACCDLRNPMISGRGLGATGGTLDKLEAIPGFRTDLDVVDVQRVTNEIGCVITGATANIAPADRKLYALRDVTATVPSIPLITASIMSKKLAEGLSALVLDVKFGSGAFMKSQTDARALARSLVDTGRQMGVQTTALLTDMNQPLGRMVGNAVEVDESIAALRGDGPTDLIDVTLALGAELLVMTETCTATEDGQRLLKGHIDSGRATEKFAEMVRAQGGDVNAPRPISSAHDVVATRSGYIQEIDAEALGRVVIELGGGRRVMSDVVDHSVGLEMLVRVGDEIQSEQPIARIFAPAKLVAQTEQRLRDAFVIDDSPVTPLPLIVDTIG